LILTPRERDGITPNQDFIISSHPRCKRLYIATGGSFHGWKFLPIIGKYVVQMLDGTLDESRVKRWAWDRDQKGSAHDKIMPKRELKDVL
jgi:sarcosine oxidase/L-pipecolate oxidase